MILSELQGVKLYHGKSGPFICLWPGCDSVSAIRWNANIRSHISICDWHLMYSGEVEDLIEDVETISSGSCSRNPLQAYKGRSCIIDPAPPEVTNCLVCRSQLMRTYRKLPHWYACILCGEEHRWMPIAKQFVAMSGSESKW